MDTADQLLDQMFSSGPGDQTMDTADQLLDQMFSSGPGDQTMDTADQLLDQMFSWIEQAKRCAEQLSKLSRELESLRKRCNAGQCVGNSVSVVGAGCLIGSCLVTRFTGGLAAPALGAVGLVSGFTGAVVSVTTQHIEDFISSGTMKDALKLAKKVGDIAEKIKQLFQRLMEERKTASSDHGESGEEGRHVIDQILGIMSRGGGVNSGKATSNIATSSGLMQMVNVQRSLGLSLPVLIGLSSILTFSVLKTGGKIARMMIKTEPETATARGAMVVGGAAALGLALTEAIGDWKELVKGNHMTEDSHSVIRTAVEILMVCQTLEAELQILRKTMIDQTAQSDSGRVSQLRSFLRTEEGS